MAYEEVGLRLRTDGVVETTTGLDMTAAGLDKVGRQAAAAAPLIQRAGLTAGQTRQAFQQLPMQLQDVAVSLAGGMPLWMVLAQQGPQITSSFGGVRETFSALLGTMNPMRLALGGVGTALALTTAGFVLGRQEALAYERAILLTGNAAGVTSGALDAMARRSDAIAGSQAQAAAALAQLVSTGRVSNAQLELGTQAAIALQRSFGVEVEKTVGILAKLGQDPVKATAELNAQTNFLTESVWRQIRALQEQGRVQEASAVAQEAYSRSAIERAAQLEERLGTLEKAWRGIGSGAREAWDFMLGLGRERTVEQQLADVQERLAAPMRRGVNPLQAQERREGLRQREAELQEMLRLQNRQADAQAQAAARLRGQVDKDVNPGPAAQPLSAIRDARMQYQQDFLRSEKAFYNELAKLEAEEQARQEGIDEANTRRAREYEQERTRAAQAAERFLATVEQQRDALIDEAESIGLSARALVERRQAEVDAQIAALERTLAMRDAIEVNDAETESIRRTVGALRQKRDAMGARFNAQERQREIEEAQRRSDSIQNSIIDGLVNGFRDGRRPADIFLNEFKAQAARTVLKFPMQLIGDALAQSTSGLGDVLRLLPGLFGGGGGGGVPVETGPPLDVADMGFSVSGGERAGRMSAGRGAPGAAAAGQGSGVTYVFSPSITVDSRTDRAEVMDLVQRANEASMAQFIDRMDRRES